MRVCIIGAGAAGLSSAKHCLDKSYECDVYEQTGKIGGIWNYTEALDYDEEGIPVHTVMYEDLKTNLPKELMEYRDFPYDKSIKESYLMQPEVLDYLKNYAEHFQLNRLIKFYNKVIEVKPIDLNRWLVKTKNLKTNIIDDNLYDAIMICNGHYSVPFIADIPGSEQFNGTIIHSCKYRKSEPYRNQKVIIIGAGPSGCNISELLSEVCQKVINAYAIIYSSLNGFAFCV